MAHKPQKKDPPWRSAHHALLRREVVSAVLALVIIIELASLLQSFSLPRSVQQLSSVLPGVVIALTDQERAGDQLGSLASNPLLAQAAQDAADDMASKGYFAHVSPTGTTPWDWLSDVGYQYQYAGQNLAVNFSDSQQLMDAWMASPEHRANILDPHYTQIGVGMATGTYQGQQVVFVAEFFASPLQTTPAEAAVASTQKTPNTKISTPAAPTSTATTSVAAGQKPLPTTPTVAAAETAPPSLWARISSSPRTYATDALIAIAAVFMLLLLLGLLPLSNRRLHPKMALNGLALVAVILGILVLNKNLLGSNVTLPRDSQNAAVILALPAR